MNRKRLLPLRILLIFLTIAVMVVIFFLSADNADESNAKSEVISDSLIYRILSSFDWNAEQTEKITHITVKIVRKTAHFSEYALLGMLLTGVCLSFGKSYGVTFTVSQAVSSLYAVSDELHQYFVPGRSCQLSDMLLDSCGAAVGIGMLLLLIWLIRRKKRRSALQ